MAVRPEVSSPKTSWSASTDIATALIASLLVGGAKTMPMKATGWRAARRIRVCFVPFADMARWRAEGPYVPLAMGLDPGDDLWPDVCACLAPDQYSEMLQPNPNLAWILNDTHIRCGHRVDTRFD